MAGPDLQRRARPGHRAERERGAPADDRHGRRRELRRDRAVLLAGAGRPLHGPEPELGQPHAPGGPLPGDGALPGPQGSRLVLRLRPDRHGERGGRAWPSGRMPPEAEITSPTGTRSSTRAAPRSTCAARSSARGGALPLRARGGARLDAERHAMTSSRCRAGTATAASAAASSPAWWARVDVAALRRRFPPSAGDFTRARARRAGGQSSNGRPNSDPYGFTLRLRVESGGAARRGPPQPVPAPRRRPAARLPALAPERRRGLARVRRPRRRQPQRADRGHRGRHRPRLPARRQRGAGLAGARRRACRSTPAAPRSRAARCRPTRAAARSSPRRRSGDLDRDGVPEVVAADYEGRVYAWNADGTRRWTRSTRLEWSGRPLQPFDEARKGERNRTQRGFIGSPVLADLDGDGRLEVVAAAMDRHVYAWRAGGASCPASRRSWWTAPRSPSIDPATHQVTFNEQAGELADAGRDRGHARRGRPHRRRPARDRRRARTRSTR